MSNQLQSQSETREFKVGQVYEAKRPRRVGHYGFLNDRQILWIGVTQIQYDSPSVRIGAKHPIIDIKKFEEWAGKEVTDKMPTGDWRN